MIKAILFDAGGTLIHMDRRFFIQTLNENGVSADVADLIRADVAAKREISRILRSESPGTDASRWSAYARVLMHELRCEGAALEAVRAAVRARNAAGTLWSHVEEDTIPALEAIRGMGFRLGVVSNADGRVAGFLEYVGLARYFDVIVDSGLYGIEKPDPRIFLHACATLGAEPARTLYIGDVYDVDVVGARRAGLTPILLAQTGEPDCNCSVIKSLAELPSIVLQYALQAAV